MIELPLHPHPASRLSLALLTLLLLCALMLLGMAWQTNDRRQTELDQTSQRLWNLQMAQQRRQRQQTVPAGRQGEDLLRLLDRLGRTLDPKVYFLSLQLDDGPQLRLRIQTEQLPLAMKYVDRLRAQSWIALISSVQKSDETAAPGYVLGLTIEKKKS